LAKANRNSSPTYSLVRFAPSHSLRMGDFFQKAVKKVYCGPEKHLKPPETEQSGAIYQLVSDT
ncbi:hypothetical protein, partial [Heyndrickxia coagulans]|uniref:hypothetical protein n=1 Tax=Heyndrickxia coagulans TaxID=1398 RepID=UPI001B7F8578